MQMPRYWQRLPMIERRNFGEWKMESACKPLQGIESWDKIIYKTPGQKRGDGRGCVFLVESDHIIMWGCCTLSKLVSEKRCCILDVITFILEGTSKARRIWMFTMKFKNTTITSRLPKPYHRKRYSFFNTLNNSNAVLSAIVFFLVSLLSCLYNHPIEAKLENLEITRHFLDFFT